MAVYDFPEEGDILPMHSHHFSDNHITIIARGRIFVRTDTWEQEIPVGTILDWDVGEKHEFVSLEPNSRIINILKNV